MKGTLTDNVATLRLPVTAGLAVVASSLCLGATFLTTVWFLPTVGAVIFTVAGAELVRRLPVPRTLVPLGGAVALLAYIVLRYARDQALLWVIPGPEAFDELSRLLDQGQTDIARFAAPIGVSPGIEFLAVAGVGLTALVVDTVAVTMRRAALAGLPLLALYTVPTSVVPDGVSWFAFALGGAAYLALLLAEARERVSRWGRPLNASRQLTGRADVETAPLAQVGRRVGAAALGLALVVPALLPQLDPESFGFGAGGFGDGSGSGNTVAVVNPIVELGKDLRRGEDRTVLRYTGRPTYLRIVGLDVFTGERWQPRRLRVSSSRNNIEDGLVPPPGLDDGITRESTRHSVEIFGLDQRWLPLPYPAREVNDIDGRWVYEPATFNVFSVNRSTQDLEYDVRSVVVGPTPEQLRNAEPSTAPSLTRFLQLPTRIPAVVEETARQITGGQRTDYDRALALQQWLRDPQVFTYSTRVADEVGDAHGAQAIAEFLKSRRGYCVHFASTMAVMARQLGIPARVAVGYTPGTAQGGGSHLVTLHDLHSWPELYFQGVGWIAFEPTPASRTGSPPRYARLPAPAPVNPTASPSALPGDRGDAVPSGAPRDPRDPDVVPAGGAAGPPPTLLDRLRSALVPGLVVLGLLLLGLVPAMTRVVVRRRRWVRARQPGAHVTAAWAELRDTLVDYGYDWRPSDPPRRGAQRVVAEMELPFDAGESVGRLAKATEQARYAVDPADPGDLREDVDRVRTALAVGATRRERLRARLMPRSTRDVAAGVSERFADVLDAVDVGLARLGRRVLPWRRTT